MDESNHSPAEQDGRLGRMFRAFRHRNYRLFFLGQFISLTGTWLQLIAQSWLVYRLTDSPLLLGLTGFANQFPVFLLASLGGVVADRHSRYRLLLATQSASMALALMLAVLTLGGWIQVWHIFALAAALGVVNAFDIPTRQAFVVEMVGRADLGNAIALNSSMFNGARIVGPAIAGVLIAAVGEGWCFLINAVSYIAVIACLLRMRIEPKPRPPRPGSVLGQIAEGFRFVRGNLPIRSLLILLGITSLTGMPYAVLMPIFADRILDAGPGGLGTLMSFSGLGAIMGALTLAARREVRGLGRWVPAGAFGFGLSLILFSLSREFWLSAALLIPVGFCFMVQMAASNTLMQMMVPDAFRGRVMALYSMMFMGMAPLGALWAGAMAKSLGAPLTVILGGACSMLAAIWFGRNLPRIRSAAHRLTVAEQMSGGAPAQEVTGEDLARR